MFCAEKRTLSLVFRRIAYITLSAYVLTSISRGGFDDGASRLQTAITLGLLDHAKTNTVLDRSTSVKELALCHYYI